MDDYTIKILGNAAVFLIGAMVGATELMSRYPDSPFRAIRNWYGLSYLLVNALGAIATLYLIQKFNWDFGLGGAAGGSNAGISGAASTQVQLVQWLAASFGAMSILRSSLFNVRLGETDLGVGPAAVLQVLLNAADRQVDRMRAKERSEAVKTAMKGIDSYAQIKIALPTHCMALMQNVSSDEEKRIRQVADNIEQLEVADCLKVLNLGLVLMNIVGDAVLKTAVANVVQTHHQAMSKRSSLGLPNPPGRGHGSPAPAQENGAAPSPGAVSQKPTPEKSGIPFSSLLSPRNKSAADTTPADSTSSSATQEPKAPSPDDHEGK